MTTAISAALAEWASEMRYADVPETVRERARLQTASVLGAVCAAADSELVMRVRDAASSWGEGEEASFLPHGPQAPLPSACYVNAVASVAFDHDDYLFAAHTGHSAVIASLAFGEMLGSSGEDVMTAQVVANELGGRLGAAFLLGPHNGQMWTYVHALCGAAIASRFLGLEAERTQHAIGIALSQPPYPLAPGFFGPDSKALFAAEPLVAGIRAAELAARGLTGPADPIGGEGGMLASIARRPLPFAFGALGSAWVTESIAFKPYPGCAYVDTPVDALTEIVQRFGDKHGRALRPDDVEQIQVEATLFTEGMERMAEPHRLPGTLRPVDVNFSVALSFGVLIARGALDVEALEHDELADHRAQIESVAARVRVAATEEMNAKMRGLGDLGIDTLRLFDPAYEPTLDGADFSRYTMSFPARVTLRTTAGEEYVAEAEIARGAAGRPLEETTAVVREKFLAGARAARVPDPELALDAVLRYDDLPDVEALIESLQS